MLRFEHGDRVRLVVASCLTAAALPILLREGKEQHVNQPTVGGEAQLPFGGIKATGVGEKEMAAEGANFFTYLKTVWLDYTGARRTTNIY